MAKSNSVDSLPPGWTMGERVRRDGKRDKYYYAPSNGPIFNSRVEVSRYLEGKQINHKNAKRKKKRALKKPWKIIAVEKVNAEALPPGWTGEILVKERNHIIRRDPYYFEPVSKTVLRSVKAIFRYLEARELTRCSRFSEGSKDESTFSTAVIKKGQLLISPARRQINFDQISDMSERVRDCQRVGKVLSAKETVEDGLAMDESGKPQPGLSKSNKVSVLPRRSKRLAGIELDQLVELKPKTRARRVSAKQSGDRVASTDEVSNTHQLNTETETKCNIEPSKYFSDNSYTSEGKIVHLETVLKCNEEQISSFEHKADLPLGELLMDPCIAFAIKLLTEVNFDGLESLEVLLGNNSDRSLMNLTTDLSGSEDHMIDGKQVEQTAVSLREHAPNVESETNSTESPWKDPCIDFAVRTLTNEFPLVYSPNIEHHSQQQLSSPKTRGSYVTSLASVDGVTNSGQAELLHHQFHDAKKPELESLDRSGIISLQSSSLSTLNQRGKERQ